MMISRATIIKSSKTSFQLLNNDVSFAFFWSLGGWLLPCGIHNALNSIEFKDCHIIILKFIKLYYCFLYNALNSTKFNRIVQWPLNSKSIECQVFVNGLVCKEARLVQPDDFFYRGLQLMGNTSNAVGFVVCNNPKLFVTDNPFYP
uniref:Uncharacterized protein n=1 Tax=Lactuca sativa TaxID=4236 RepID=A0A9R1UH72_LACSA|nr:hypothetical protein LSAT_V11C900496470 [Lactuca sativa]